MADDRGQDVVEVVRDAAGELADHLHLGRLGDLALELGLLAIVLEQQQHRGVAEAAHAGDGQRDRLGVLAREPDREIAGHRRAAGVAAHRIGDRRLVFLDHEIAGIGRHRCALDPGGDAERAVHGQEAAVAIDQREADRQDFEQRLEVGAVERAPAVGIDQQIGAGPAVSARIDGHVDRLHRPRRFAVGQQPHLPVLGELDEVGEAQFLGLLLEAHRAACERAVGGDQHPVVIDQRGEQPGRREPLADRPGEALGSDHHRVRRSDLRERHSSRSPLAPTRSTSTAAVPEAVATPATQPPPSRHAIVRTSCSDCDDSSSLPSVSGAGGAAEAVAIGAVGDQQATFAVGQRGRVAAQAERRTDHRIIRREAERGDRRRFGARLEQHHGGHATTPAAANSAPASG